MNDKQTNRSPSPDRALRENGMESATDRSVIRAEIPPGLSAARPPLPPLRGEKEEEIHCFGSHYYCDPDDWGCDCGCEICAN